MRWDRGHQSSNVDDRRAEGPAIGSGGGGALPVRLILGIASRFGWKGILVALVIIGAVMYGGGMCSTQTSPPEQPPSSASRGSGGQPAAGPTDELAQFVGFVLDDIQDTWTRQLRDYRPTRLTLFRNSIRSACGTASAAVGPFYCPGDSKVYIDLAFYELLRREFGAPGDFAQAYVIAHEVGHHIQNLRGLLGRGEVNSIETELQADCIAGAWGRDADRRGRIEVGDFDEAVNAARQIGDDSIQRKTQGYVQPETWTHGSAQQRSAAFNKGLQGGIAACGIR
ncbi:MAG: neutral zinc metallopeptidase [Kofleriaceae bacterium]